jgi:hypothetical protein
MRVCAREHTRTHTNWLHGLQFCGSEYIHNNNLTFCTAAETETGGHKASETMTKYSQICEILTNNI